MLRARWTPEEIKELKEIVAKTAVADHAFFMALDGFLLPRHSRASIAHKAGKMGLKVVTRHHQRHRQIGERNISLTEQLQEKDAEIKRLTGEVEFLGYKLRVLDTGMRETKKQSCDRCPVREAAELLVAVMKEEK